jgi:hypothetical protein
MTNHQDYTIRQGVGIRVEAGQCRVIRKFKNEWREIGPVYEIPVEPRFLAWTPPAIPPGVLAVALRAYELDHPGTRLRHMLTMSQEQRRRLVMTKPLAGRARLQEARPAAVRPLRKAAGL